MLYETKAYLRIVHVRTHISCGYGSKLIMFPFRVNLIFKIFGLLSIKNPRMLVLDNNIAYSFRDVGGFFSCMILVR